MRKLPPVLLIFLSHTLFAQNNKTLLEIAPLIRYDRHPSFAYSVGPLDTPNVVISGVSWGITAAYKMVLAPKFYLRLGGGYYRQAFNHINTTNRFGTNARRHITYPSVMDIAFFTDRYWYNCLFASLGMEKHIQLSKSWTVAAGANIDMRYTVSQGYHITYSNPNRPIVNPYRRKDRHTFSATTILHAGLWKKKPVFGGADGVIASI